MSAIEKSVIIATRGSELALWQAHFLQAELKNQGVDSTLNIIKTKGDKIQDLSFDKIEGKGFFTKEIEDALLDGSAHIAVHSMKDLPTDNPEGLVIGALSYREDARDCLLINKSSVAQGEVLKLQNGAVIGTSSSRRKAQMLHLRNDLVMKDIRGNVPTRIQKLRDGHYDGILLAAAGVTRLALDLSDFEVIYFHPREFTPAPSQGVLAFQCRAEDVETRKILAKLHHSDVSSCTNVERKVLKMMGGGCHMPLGVYCEKDSAGNYRAYGSMAHHVDEPLTKVSIAQTTTDQLAENLFNALNKK
ncbi:MAG: hydroxymethylbilane synthase [Saprospiraceae bacterium]|nr:hydroxymethylbilane synthase [Saprospiraceae bacterium]